MDLRAHPGVSHVVHDRVKTFLQILLIKLRFVWQRCLNPVCEERKEVLCKPLDSYTVAEVGVVLLIFDRVILSFLDSELLGKVKSEVPLASVNLENHRVAHEVSNSLALGDLCAVHSEEVDFLSTALSKLSLKVGQWGIFVELKGSWLDQIDLHVVTTLGVLKRVHPGELLAQGQFE